MLSHDDDRHLRAIEQWFEETDPELSRAFRDYEPPGRASHRRALQVAAGSLGALLLLVGALAALPGLMLFGILIIGVGVSRHLGAH